jgi:hypothetical protein
MHKFTLRRGRRQGRRTVILSLTALANRVRRRDGFDYNAGRGA